jgi:Uma2 family endonuclease
MGATATAAEPRLMTFEEFEALPDDGVERWLIRGVLHEKGEPTVTKRNRFHARAEASIAHVLNEWLHRQPSPRGEVYAGEVGCRLRGDPDSGCGIDVAYFSSATVASQSDESTMMIGPPVVAVEILSPNNTIEEIDEKVDEYLDAGVPHIWLVNTHWRTVTVIRPGVAPTMLSDKDDLTAEPDLPGFRVPVARLFGG